MSVCRCVNEVWVFMMLKTFLGKLSLRRSLFFRIVVKYFVNIDHVRKVQKIIHKEAYDIQNVIGNVSVI